MAHLKITFHGLPNIVALFVSMYVCVCVDSWVGGGGESMWNNDTPYAFTMYSCNRPLQIRP